MKTLTLRCLPLVAALFGAFAAFAPTSAQAQETEAGVHVFSSNYLGDLSDGISEQGGGYFSYFAKQTRPGLGAFIRFNQSPRIAYRGNASYSQVYGSDGLSKSRSKNLRNLSFRSEIIEISGMVEYNILPFGNGQYERSFTPYVFLGLGITRFNPQASWAGEYYNLQSLGTEGQDLVAYPDRKRYALTVPSIPVGGGLKFRLDDSWRLGIEYGHRFLFTDYLDDVSSTHADREVLGASRGAAAAALADRSGEVIPGGVKRTGSNRGNPDNKDAYYFVGFTVSYLFDRTFCPRP